MNIQQAMRKVAIILTLFFLLGLALQIYQWCNGNTYRMHCYVSGYDGEWVRFTDYATENDFWWGDRDDWDMWDNAVLTMDDNGTPADMTDDIIVSAIYERSDS